MSLGSGRRALLNAAVRTALLLLLPVTAPVRSGATSNAAALDERQRAYLLLVVRRLYPHDVLPDEPYLGVVDALDAAAADPALERVIAAGLERLDARVSGSWFDASAAVQTRALEELVSDPFFAVARQTAAYALYNDPDVWKAFGYGGNAWRFGGYLGRGLADIDWLPHPGADSSEGS